MALGLASADERRLVAIQLLTQLANQSTYFVGFIGVATYELGGTALTVSATTFSMNVTLCLASAVAGVVIDRLGARRTMEMGIAAFAAGMLFAFLCSGSLVAIIVSVTLSAAAYGLLSMALLTFPAFIAQGLDERKRLNSVMDATINVAVVLGPLVAGTVAHLGGSPWVFVFGIGCLGLALPLALRCPEGRAAAAGEGTPEEDADRGTSAQEAPDAPARTGLFADLSEGIRIVRQVPVLRQLFWCCFLGYFAYGAFDGLESLFYRDVLRLGSEWMGWLSAAVGLGAVAGSLLLTRIPSDRVNLRLLAAALAQTGLGAMLYTGTKLLPCALAGQVACGFGFGLLSPVSHVLTQELTPVSHVGRVSALMRIAMQSAGIVPLLVAPFLASAIGVQPTLFAASVTVALIGAALYLVTKRKAT